MHARPVEQLADLFRTTHRVKTQQVSKRRGQRCVDIEIAAYLANDVGLVSFSMSVGEVGLTLVLMTIYITPLT